MLFSQNLTDSSAVEILSQNLTDSQVLGWAMRMNDAVNINHCSIMSLSQFTKIHRRLQENYNSMDPRDPN